LREKLYNDYRTERQKSGFEFLKKSTKKGDFCYAIVMVTNMKKQQSAFAVPRKMLKGGLHCHTTRSDGKVSPEDVMKLHKENGYDFLAITDHRRYNYKNFVPELGLTIVPGMEFDTHIPCDHGLRCYHTVCIGPAKEKGNGFEQDVLLDSVRTETPASYQPYLDDFHEKKNLTIHCHPEWSGTPAKYFETLKGNFAMEIWNSGCAMNCDMDYDAAYWDELLGQGIKIYGVATDDGHAAREHCKGWVMVNAENDLDAILEALAAGDFYSSCGPEIYDFYVEDGTAYIKCSPVRKIRLHADAQPTRIVRGEDGLITEASFELKRWTGPYAYVRMSVIDENGKYAWTNPIFLTEE